MDADKLLNRILATIAGVFVFALLISPADLRNKALLEILSPLVYVPIVIVVGLPAIIALIRQAGKETDKNGTHHPE